MMTTYAERLAWLASLPADLPEPENVTINDRYISIQVYPDGLGEWFAALTEREGPHLGTIPHEVGTYVHTWWYWPPDPYSGLGLVCLTPLVEEDAP